MKNNNNIKVNNSIINNNNNDQNNNNHNGPFICPTLFDRKYQREDMNWRNIKMGGRGQVGISIP